VPGEHGRSAAAPQGGCDARVISWLHQERDRCFTSAIVIAQLAYWVWSKEGRQRHRWTGRTSLRSRDRSPHGARAAPGYRDTRYVATRRDARLHQRAPCSSQCRRGGDEGERRLRSAVMRRRACAPSVLNAKLDSIFSPQACR
jgi:hypothetical protein